MAGLATTKMSSKGQVVTPEKIRTRLGSNTGSQFVVVSERDTDIFAEYQRVAGTLSKQFPEIGLVRFQEETFFLCSITTEKDLIVRF